MIPEEVQDTVWCEARKSEKAVFAPPNLSATATTRNTARKISCLHGAPFGPMALCHRGLCVRGVALNHFTVFLPQYEGRIRRPRKPGKLILLRVTRPNPELPPVCLVPLGQVRRLVEVGLQMCTKVFGFQIRLERSFRH